MISSFVTRPFYAVVPIAVLVIIMTCSSLAAQNVSEYGPFLLQRFTETDGLVSSDATGIYRDRRGFLWISTFNGVSRFDGRSFENFNRDNGLPENNAAVLGEDKAGRIYINSINNVYRYTGNTVAPFLRYPTRGTFINDCCPDSAGRLWVCYEGDNDIYQLSEKGVEAHIALSVPVLQFARGQHYEMYVLQAGGQVSEIMGTRLRPVRKIQAIPPYQGDGVKLYTDVQKRVWGYGAGNSYVYRYEDGRVADSLPVPRDTRWRNWVIGSGGNMYMESDSGGICQLIGGKWQVILGRTQIKGATYEIQEEADDRFWICCSNGLLKISRKQYENTPATGTPYYFTAGSNGACLLKNDGLLEHIPMAMKYYRQLGPARLSNVFVARNKDVWFCTWQAVYHLKYGKGLEQLKTTNTYAGPGVMFGFRRILEDAAGGIWISSYHGVFYQHPDGRLEYFYNREGINENALYALATDSAGAFYTSSLKIYAYHDGTFETISPQLGLTYEPTRLANDRFGRVWACQGQSRIVCIGRRGNGQYFAADSLQLSVNGQRLAAQYICFDTANNLWITDNHSLYFYRYANGGYRNAGYPVLWEENLSSNPGMFSDGGGRLMVLSTPVEGNYLRSYALSKLLHGVAADQVSVQLTSIRLFREPYDWAKDGYSTDPLGIPQHLVLKHRQNFLKFYFSGLTTDSRHGIAYRYRLGGYDKGWSPPTETGEVEYTGLPPGQYTLEVEARSTAGAWSAPLAYSFKIDAAWYHTWWAICVWAILSLGLAGLLIYTGWKTLARRAHLRQLVVEEQLKALRAQINPHFLQNTFAFLAHELAIAPRGDAIKSIDQVSTYLRNVLRFSDQTSVTLEEELEFAEEYLQLQQHLMSTPFRYSIEVAPDVDLFDTRTPSMLLQPVIENALKHGLDAEAENKITIRVSQTDDWVKCTISDTGNRSPRRPQTAVGSGKGIALTGERIRLYYNGKKKQPQFFRRPNAAGGCDVTIFIPLK